MAGRYDDRVRDLLDDAEEAARRGDWDAVRDLAGAATVLSGGSPDAQRLLELADAATPSAGERRQLTVMFCDVVGSTALSQEHDPELVREVLRSYQVTCDRVVRRYEGRVARFIGDGVLAYFGVPVPHEDDARRGVKAGLDLLDALRPVIEEVRERYEVDLRIRVAVHTGLVVRGDMGSVTTPDRDAIVGDTPNIAARLQDHAEPGTLLISHDTFELVRPWFLVAPRGALTLKGVDRPVRAYQVVQESGEDDRVLAQADLSPFVGRAEELDLLSDAWTEAREGGLRVVAVSGQPGVGKSRLVDVLRRRVEVEDGTTLTLSCSSFHDATALHPVRRLLERIAGIEPHQEPELALSRLWAAMDSVGQTDTLPLVASLLELPPTSWCPAPELEGPKLREELLATLVDWLRAAASRGPVLLLVDDLQWADPSTVELVARVIGGPVPGVLVAATIREDAKVPWSSATVIQLDRLSASELSDLAHRLPEGRRLEEGHLAEVIERSDGIPLYLEELLRSSRLANPAGTTGRSSIPAALRDLLLARFAAPGVELRTAQVLATIGVDASLPLVARASNLAPSQLDLQLSALVDANIVTVEPGEVLTYRFRHHLLADLAYDTQLQAARRTTHSAVADALLGGHPDMPAVEPTVLAHHLEQAGRPAEAIAFLAAAAEDAQGLGANAEVEELLLRAFDLLPSVPPDDRREMEFQLRLLRGMHASSILGYAAPQAVEDFGVCRDLVSESSATGAYLDDPDADGRHHDEVVWSGCGLWATFMLQGRLADAHTVNRSIVDALRPDGDVREYLDCWRAYVDFFEGAYPAAVTGLTRAIEIFPRVKLPATTAIPNDPGPTAHAHLAFALEIECRLDEARAVSDVGIELARAMPFPRGPFTFCYVASMRSALEQIAGDLVASRRWSTEVAETAERHGYVFWSITAGFQQALIDLGQGVDGAAERCEMTLMLIQSLGIVVWLPCWMGSLADQHLLDGSPDLARPLHAQATEVAERTAAHFWTGMLLRQDGEIRLAAGDPIGLDRLREAAAFSEASGASLHELYARTAIARHTGSAEDRAALAALVDAVSAGAPPPSLAAARAVLA